MLDFFPWVKTPQTSEINSVFNRDYSEMNCLYKQYQIEPYRPKTSVFPGTEEYQVIFQTFRKILLGR